MNTLRRKSTKPSRTKKSPSRKSSRKTKVNRSKKSSKFNFSSDKCKLHVKNLSEKDITNFVKLLLKSQNRRVEIAQELKNRSKFGMISNVKKGVTYVKSRVSYLVNIIKSKTNDAIKSRLLFPYIDVGIRLPYDEENSYSNFLINLIVFSYSLSQDWQFWLILPVSQKMLFNIVNDRKKMVYFLLILQQASIQGVNPTDIFYGIPNMGIDICDPVRYKWMFNNYLDIIIVINKIGRLGQVKLVEFVEKKFINYLSNSEA